MVLALEGLRVVRGPDWKWGDQDGGEGCVGTVVSGRRSKSQVMREKLNSLRAETTAVGYKNEESLRELERLVLLQEIQDKLVGRLKEKEKERKENAPPIVAVCWDSGSFGTYRAGFDGAFDLRVLDYGLLGKRHPNVSCGSQNCGSEIVGVRWECVQCQISLCTQCLLQVDIRHDPTHTNFQRYETPEGPAIQITLKNKRKIPFKGIFPGAEVKRGPDWKNGNNEDAGDIGVVVGTPIAGKVYVKWPENPTICLYRRGAEGKMDLKAVKASTGGHYHPDWLPVVKVETKRSASNLSQPSASHSGFREGQKVKIKLEGEELRAKQYECCDWDPFLNKFFGIIGVVCKVDDSKVCVEYAAYGKKWIVNPAILERVSPYSNGQVVRILWSEATTNLNGGDTGKVKSIEDDGTVNVKLRNSDGTKETINLRPECIESMPISKELLDRFSRWKKELIIFFLKAASDGEIYLMKEMLSVSKMKIIDAGAESLAGMTALHFACGRGRLDVVQWLLDHGADVEKSDYKGRRAVHHAVKMSQTRVLELLIQKGANVNPLTTKKRRTPLQKAVAERYTECAKILIRNSCDVNLQDFSGDTPLHNAAYRAGNQMITEENMNGVPEIVDAIVKSGRADLTLRNKKGLNVMHVAAGLGNIWMVKYLLENDHGHLAFDVDLNLFSPLLIACLKSHYEIGKLIVEFMKKNGDAFPQASTSSQDDFDCPEKRLIDARDKNGVTPLMLSCYNGNYPLVELLVCNGADVNATDKDGDTPIIFLSLRMRKEKKRTVPNAEKSPAIRMCYDENIGQEAMRENPLLAAFCFLIQNQGKLTAVNKMGRTALNIIDDPIVTSFLDEFYLPFKLSMTTVETVESTEMKDIISVKDGFCILCPKPVPVPYVFQPCAHPVMACTTCGPFLQRCSQPACNCVPTNSHPVDYIKVIDQDEEGFQKGNDEGGQSQVSVNDDAASGYTWKIEPKGSRKGFDLLHDGTGNTYSKRPASGKGVTMWQCTKKSDTGTNKCPVTVKQLLNTFVHLNLPHKHCKFAL